MKKSIAFFVIAVLILNTGNLAAQEKPFHLLKFGVKGFGGITDTCYLNTMINNWFDNVVSASNADLENEQFTLPFNIEYGFQPFFIVQPVKYLQIGLKLDCSFSDLAAKFQNPLTSQNYELNIKMESFNPGVFANLTFGKIEMGGGIFKSYTNIEVNDSFYGYKDTWRGSNTGYELSLGFSSTRERRAGFTMAIKYHDLFIDDFEDTMNRKITYTGTQEKMSVNRPGFFLEIGFYFQFINMKKQKDEN
jgi:hypothetical protein